MPAVAPRRALPPLLILTLLLGLAAVTATTPVAADPQLNLAAARAAADGGDRDRAITFLHQALAEDNTLTVAYRRLARLYDDKGLREQALDPAAAAVSLDPAPDDRAYLSHLLADGCPASLAMRTLDAIEAPHTLFAITPASNPGEAPIGPRRGAVIAWEGPVAASDPLFNWTFDRACYGYVLNPAGDRWQLAAVTHYDASGGAARREIAANIVGVVLRAACLREAFFSGDAMPPDAVRPVQVWLTNDGRPGGESWGGNIYIYASGIPRPPEEWLRQVLHEYGHAVLPGVDHFVAPESWANGVLGETLFSRWLARSDEDPQVHPWLMPAVVNSLATEAKLRRDLFMQQGPSSPLIGDPGPQGMDYFAGFALYVAEALGPRTLRTAMDSMQGVTPRAFVVAVQTTLGRMAATGITLQPAAPRGAARAPQWLYVPGGRFVARCSGTAAAVSFGKLTITRRWRSVGRLEAGWHRISLPPDTTATFRATGR